MSQNNDNTINIPLLTDTRPSDLVKDQKDRLPPETTRPDSIPQQEGTVGNQQEAVLPLDTRLNTSREIPAFDIPLPLPVFPDNQDVRSIVLDTLKNISINGISPQISGSSISFNIPESPYSASQLWGLMNTANVLGDVSSSAQTYGGPVIQSSAEQSREARQVTQSGSSISGVSETGTNVNDNVVTAQPAAFDAPSTTGYITPTVDSAAVNPTQPTVVTPVDINSAVAATSTTNTTNTTATASATPIATSTATTPSVGPLTDALNNTYSGASTGGLAGETTNTSTTTTSGSGVDVIAGPNIISGGASASNYEPANASDSASNQYYQSTSTGNISVQHSPSTEPIPALQTADQANYASTQLLAVPFKRGDRGAPQMVYFVTAGYEPIESEPKPYQNIRSGYGGPDFTPIDYWIPVGSGGGGGGTFLASLVFDEQGNVKGVDVSSGSYHILNTNTDVPKQSGNGDYVYAIIEHSNAGVFKEFKIEISSSTKDPTNLDTEGKFVQFSNILLAEKMTQDGKPIMVQRRVGNLSLVHQLVSGRLCLWAYSSGGTSL